MSIHMLINNNKLFLRTKNLWENHFLFSF